MGFFPKHTRLGKAERRIELSQQRASAKAEAEFHKRQAVIPETPGRTVPTGPLRPKVGQTDKPLDLEMVELDRKQGDLF